MSLSIPNTAGVVPVGAAESHPRAGGSPLHNSAGCTHTIMEVVEANQPEVPVKGDSRHSKLTPLRLTLHRCTRFLTCLTYLASAALRAA